MINNLNKLQRMTSRARKELGIKLVRMPVVLRPGQSSKPFIVTRGPKFAGGNLASEKRLGRYDQAKMWFDISVFKHHVAPPIETCLSRRGDL